MGSIKKAFDLSGRSALVTGAGLAGLLCRSRKPSVNIGEQGAKILLSSPKAADLEQAPEAFCRSLHRGRLGRCTQRRRHQAARELLILAASVGTRSERQERSHLDAFSRGRVGGRMRVSET
jgi:hypothetical protein